MQGPKETASNVAASAKSGLEKAEATAQEKVEKMTTRDPVEKEMARERKEERVTQAELDKQEARGHTGTHDYTATETGGAPDYLTGDPGYTTGVQPTHPPPDRGCGRVAEPARGVHGDRAGPDWGHPDGCGPPRAA